MLLSTSRTRRISAMFSCAEQFERFKALFGGDSEESDLHALYPLVEQSFGKAGWDDPEMDVYNDYDAHRPKP